MALSEIEKLERRYAENPQGLTFAPLAEIHRKNGEVQRALDLLGPGLETHPDYIPASIVLGRCRMDLGDIHAAESAFLRVLALDGENVIALKALADISERMLKFDDAERWLNTLLTVDRSNDDAREQLQRVEISRRQAEMGSSAEPSSVAESPGAAESSPAAGGAGVPEPSTAAETPTESEPSRMGMEGLETSTLREQFVEHSEMSVEEPAALEFEQPAGFQLEEPDLPDEPPRLETVAPLDGLVGRELDIDLEESAGDFRVETSEDIVLESAGGGEFQMPDASQELFAVGGQGVRGPFEENAALPNTEWETPRAEPIKAEAAAQADEPVSTVHARKPLEEPEPEPSREPEVTAALGPGNFRSQRRDEEVRLPAAPPRRSYAAGDTGGRSVAQLLKGILSARPPAQTSAAPVRQAPAAGSAGAPTRPAADALSLSSVFGEEASETPPAVSAQNQAGSVSFDDFFSAPSASPASRTPRAPDPKNDDLDQFHAWLQNLKR
ncbi:hypothetical protein BH24GEM1_BH24GEM1_22990 [soil metagenome]